MLSKVRVVWPSPVSLIRIWSILALGTSNCMSYSSTYWRRPGSVFGSQLGFFTNVRLFSGVYAPSLNMYGPVDHGCSAYLAGSDASPFGIGPMAGNVPQYGMSGN